MDGAVESGERAAQEVLSNLAGDDLPQGDIPQETITQDSMHRR
jgi:hypothetical protein